MSDPRSNRSISSWISGLLARFRASFAPRLAPGAGVATASVPPSRAASSSPRPERGARRPDRQGGSPAAGGKGQAKAADVIQPFLKRHRALIKKLQLEAGVEAFIVRDELAYSDRGLDLQLHAESTHTYRAQEFAKPELKNAADAEAWLAPLRAGLAARTRQTLMQAQGALQALTDLVMRPDEVRWVGGEDEVRRDYLNFPPVMAAAEATASARKRHKELQHQIAKARQDFLTSRLQRLSTARLSGKNLHSSYRESLPFLSVTLDLELNIERALDQRSIDRLIDVPEAGFQEALDALLLSSRKVLVGRVADQIRELSRRIKDLPHIERISDNDIAATVAPYYGALNKALKKRRAKSALVAVEERAREAKYQEDVIKLNEQRSAYADVASYYPLARSLKRQLILYVGPTNSGKTWRSLNALAESNSGAYLAPLRLLALEGQEELEKRGKPTSFITGEERDIKPDARFISSTIEMLNLEALIDAVVIDEVQMLADERRGWAWLAAVVGAPAPKVIMTGSPDCVELVKDLAAYLGEELTVHVCERYNELRVADAPMRLREIRPGTAIVCFSRRDVLRIKTTIQDNSELKVAVVYGNLSPQVRREEARRFRSGEAEILVATDAIAMGLNLPIKEVLFYATEKFNGEEVCELSVSDIRQIGGRAGRYGFAQSGVVNALNAKSLELIRSALKCTPETLRPPFYVSPGRNHIRIISDVLGTTSLERILTFFDRAIEFSDERFARSNIDDLSYLSTFVDERLPFLDVTERLTIASAPVAVRNETVVHWFLNRMLPAFRDPNNPDDGYEDLDDLFGASRHFERDGARSQLELRDAEDYLKTLTVYAWLAYRYPEVFTRIEECEICRETVNAFVERSLRG